MILTLFVLLLLLISTLLLLLAWTHSRRPVTESRQKELIRLRMDAPGGVWQMVDLESKTISCGFSQEDDIDLRHFIPTPKRGPRRRVLRLSAEGEKLRVEADTPLILNGVRCSEGKLGQNQFLRLNGLKLSYMGSFLAEEQFDRPRSRRERLILLAPGSLLLSAALILAAAGVARPGRAALPVVRAPQSSLDQPPSPEPPRIPPVLIAPGAPLPEAGVDILFIHAHPDDESLDFGALLAAADEAGHSTAVLLLTDGEGGIFRSDYQGPAGRLEDLRVEEAFQAMTVLGVDYYIRFGLANLPYNGTADERSPLAILDAWGETEALPARLGELIEELRPAVLVTPDGPSAAREHFEHEAAGLAVALALDQLQQSGAYRPGAHLVCIDPRQAEIYPERITFPRAEFAERQREALLSHATQADASLFGVEMIAEYGFEYYHMKYWRLDEDPALYLFP